MSRSAFSQVLAVLLVLQAAVWLVAAQCQPGEDYWKNKVVVQNVDPGFNVTYHNHYKIVNNTHLNAVYVLYCTETAPVVDIDGAKFIKVPVKTVSVTDHRAIPFIKMLGRRKTISSVAEPEKVTSQCMQDVGNATTGETADAVFVNGVGDERNSVSLSLDHDTGPLGKAEWIKFFGVFYDLEEYATKIYDHIRNSYTCNSGNINELTKHNESSIAWVAFDTEVGVWHILTGERRPSGFDVYYSTLDIDAGAVPLIGTAPIDNIDQLHVTLSNFDIVIDQTELAPNDRSFSNWRRLFGYTGERGSPDRLPPFLRQKQLYRTDKLLNENGDEDWKENAPSRPDLVLRDLIAIQDPTYDKLYVTKWLRNFAKSDATITIDSKVCPIDDPISACKPIGRDGNDNDGNDNNSNVKDKHSKAMIIAIVLGTVGGVLAIALVVGFVLWRKKQQANEKFLELRDDDAHVPDFTQVTEVPR